MARFPRLTLFLSACLLSSSLVPLTFALEVSPDSPCAASCLDSEDLDNTDPDASNISGDDIVCKDSEYKSQAKGRKYEECLTCLQSSKYKLQYENDQMWFLFNMRYAFSYCIFGYPNSTDSSQGSSRCMTSSTCEPLKAALTEDDLDPLRTSQYLYCDADSGSMLGKSYQKCLDCVKSGNDNRYLSNFLIALEAGCEQRPDPGKLIGLNGTVFSKTQVEMVDPSKLNGSGGSLTTPVIAGIAVGGAVALLAVACCVWMQCRKRRRRREEALRTTTDGPRRHRPASSLSFRCQTHLTPRSPVFPVIQEEGGEKGFSAPARPLGSNPVSPVSPVSPVDGKFWGPHDPRLSHQGGAVIVVQDMSTQPKAALANQTNGLTLTTTHLSTAPAPRMHSPRGRPSPTDEYITPTSAVSVRSSSALLPSYQPYVPASYGRPPHRVGSLSSPTSHHVNQHSPTAASPQNYTSPTSAATASPLLSQGQWPLADQRTGTTNHADSNPTPSPTTPRLSQQPQSVPLQNVQPGRQTPVSSQRGFPGSSFGTGNPIESRTLQTNFPPPPGRKR